MTADVAARSEVAQPAASGHGRRRRFPTAAVTVAVGAVVMTAAAGVVFLIATSTTTSTTLAIIDQQDGRVLYERPAEVGERFELTHTHSVTEREVVETFSVLDATTVAIEELWFDEHGANLPTGSERMGATTTTYLEEADGYRVVHHGHPIGTLPLIVGSPSVDHVVHFADGERVRLLDVAPAGALVEVSLGQRP